MDEFYAGSTVTTECGDGFCVNLGPGFLSDCRSGQKESDAYPDTTCINIDEYTYGTTDCGTSNCVNSDDGFVCTCLFEFGTVGVHPGL